VRFEWWWLERGSGSIGRDRDVILSSGENHIFFFNLGVFFGKSGSGSGAVTWGVGVGG
jgi:hypothetical protein